MECFSFRGWLPLFQTKFLVNLEARVQRPWAPRLFRFLDEVPELMCGKRFPMLEDPFSTLDTPRKVVVWHISESFRDLTDAMTVQMRPSNNTANPYSFLSIHRSKRRSNFKQIGVTSKSTASLALIFAKKIAQHLVSKMLGIKLATSYSRTTYRCTTIGAAVFHFRVRNGNGWCHCAKITRSLANPNTYTSKRGNWRRKWRSDPPDF